MWLNIQKEIFALFWNLYVQLLFTNAYHLDVEYQELDDTGLVRREITKVSYLPPGEDESSSYEEYYEEGIGCSDLNDLE